MPACTHELKIIPNAPAQRGRGLARRGTEGENPRPRPLEGRANDELLGFLAATLGIPRRNLTLLRGDKSRQKVVQIAGLDEAAVWQRLACEL